MAARTLVVTTPVLTGTSVTSASSTVASSDTMTISVTTAQSSIDLKTLHIYVANANTITTVALSLAAGSRYADIGVGAKSITIATADTVVIGGQDFEGARFQNTAGTLVFTQTGTGPTTWLAFQAPRASE